MKEIDKEQLKNYIDYKVEITMHNLFISEFSQKLNDAIKANNTSVIKEIMLPEFWPQLRPDLKEQMIFNHLVKFTKSVSEKFLNYLIFDYNISEANSIDKFQVDDSVKAMFENRRLNQELNIELQNFNKPEKKPKL